MTIFDLLQSSTYPQKPILEKLIMHQLNLSKEQLFTHLDDTISDSDLSRIHQSYTRYVIDKKPLEYILGYVTFAGLQFTVTPATIIPRPETEYMIEAVREFLEGENDKQTNTPFEKGGQGGDLISHFRTSALPQSNTSSLSPFHDSTMQRFNLLDIGTGSGILGLATLYHCGHYIDHAYLCDLSTDALDIAKQNHEKIFLQEDPSAYGTSPQRGGKGGVISFLHCSLLDHPALKQLFLSKQTDLHSSEKGAEGGLSNPNSTNPILLVANLPYIPDEMFATNADDHITKREPTMAFVGGNDGLNLYRQMLDQIIAFSLPPSSRGDAEVRGEFTSSRGDAEVRGECLSLSEEKAADMMHDFEKEQLQKRGLTCIGIRLPYNKKLTPRAKELRKQMTPAEKKLRYQYLRTLSKSHPSMRGDAKGRGDTPSTKGKSIAEGSSSLLNGKIKTKESIRFHRQYIIDHYIVDFYCPKLQLVIEIDGDTHYTDEAKRYDEERTDILEGYGLHVIRFTNDQIYHQFDAVCATIAALLPPTPLNDGGCQRQGGLPLNEGGTRDNNEDPPSMREVPTKEAEGVTLFLEMMTRQAKILVDEYQDHFTFEEIKTFHGNIRIVKGSLHLYSK